MLHPSLMFIILLGRLRIFLRLAHQVLSDYLILKILIYDWCVMISLFDSLHLTQLTINHFLANFYLPEDIERIAISLLKSILGVETTLLLYLVEFHLSITVDRNSIRRYIYILFSLFLHRVRLNFWCSKVSTFFDLTQVGLILGAQPLSVVGIS